MKSCWSLWLSKPILFVLILNPILSQAQFSKPDDRNLLPVTVPLGSYIFPVEPGHPNQLAGTMGELRNTHFHAGIDIRTRNSIGMPVVATQQGYISRMMVGAYGYGKALMITHPDGKTSLYGHLNNFLGEIGGHALKEHYRLKSFELDQTFPPQQFPINKGDTIARSGNTGGSSGPHLHFEIRNENNEATNPLEMKFSEINDILPPVAVKVALKTMDFHSRINDRFGRYEFSFVRSGSNYSLPYPILSNGTIGFELLAFDRLDRSQFRCGINMLEVFVDSIKIFEQKIDKIDFEQSRRIQMVMDYKSMKSNGVRFNKLYIDEGNTLNYYSQVKNNGLVNVNKDEISVVIKMTDAYGNKSQAAFRLKHDPTTESVPHLEPMSVPAESTLIDNTLMISFKNCGTKKDINAIAYSRGIASPLPIAYKNQFRSVCLIDLRQLVPDSVASCAGSIAFHFKDVIPSGHEYKFYSNESDIEIGASSLYDTLYFITGYKTEKNGEIFSLGTTSSPIFEPVTVTLKPKLIYRGIKQEAVYRVDNNKYVYLGGTWINGKIKFKASEWGDFTIAQDTIPPTIRTIRCNSYTARFRILDNLSGISYIEANNNGNWVLMHYDYKTGILEAEKSDDKPFEGDFELKVVDNAGNERILKQVILK